jgi:hypothetical protein
MKGEDMKRLRILLRKDQRTRQRPGQEGKKKKFKKKTNISAFDGSQH